jgi:cytochrome c-type biogenesis protein CcmF
LAILLALAFAVYAIVGSLVGKWTAHRLLAISAERAVYCVWALLTVASGVLIHALIAGDFRLSYVTEHSNRTMPTVYKFTAWWGIGPGIRWKMPRCSPGSPPPHFCIR